MRWVLAALMLMAVTAPAWGDFEDYCYLDAPPVYEDEVSALTVDALRDLEWALVLLNREPGEPPFRGDPEVALKRAEKAVRAARQALQQE